MRGVSEDEGECEGSSYGGYKECTKLLFIGPCTYSWSKAGVSTGLVSEEVMVVSMSHARDDARLNDRFGSILLPLCLWIWDIYLDSLECYSITRLMGTVKCI